MFMLQKRHSFVSGAAGAAGAGPLRRFTCLTITKTANDTITKLTIVLMKFP